MKTLRKHITIFTLLMGCTFLAGSCSKFDDEAPISLSETGKDLPPLNGNEAKYSEADLFKSVFFAYGDFARNISIYNKQRESLKTLSDSQRLELETKLNLLINDISTKDPGFLPKFKQQILSRNHQMVTSAIREGSVKIYENIEVIMPGMSKVIKKIDEDVRNGSIVSEDGKLDKAKFSNKSKDYERLLTSNMIASKYEFEPGTDTEPVLAACSWAVACAYYFALAVHNTVGLTANVAIVAAAAVYLGVTFWGPGAYSDIIDNNLNGDFKTLEFEILVQDIVLLDPYR